jgi:hypothetical protein
MIGPQEFGIAIYGAGWAGARHAAVYRTILDRARIVVIVALDAPHFAFSRSSEARAVRRPHHSGIRALPLINHQFEWVDRRVRTTDCYGPTLVYALRCPGFGVEVLPGIVGLLDMA